jgi:hypothetical protein
MDGEEKEVVSVEEKRKKPVVTPVEENMGVVKAFRTPEPSLPKMTPGGKLSIRSSASTDSGFRLFFVFKIGLLPLSNLYWTDFKAV